MPHRTFSVVRGIRRSGVSATAHSARKGESGAAAVEFALILVPFLVLVFGLLQYGLYFYGAQSGSHVANSAVRELSVGNCQNSTALRNYINNQLGGGLGDVSFADGYSGPSYKNNAGTGVSTPLPADSVGGTVTLKIKFTTPNLHFPFLPYLSDSAIKREVQARIEDTTDGGCPS